MSKEATMSGFLKMFSTSRTTLKTLQITQTCNRNSCTFLSGWRSMAPNDNIQRHFHLGWTFPLKYLFQKGLLLAGTSTDLIPLPWGKSTKPTGLFSTRERGQPLLPTRRFQLRGIKSVSLVMKCIKEPKSSLDCCYLNISSLCKLDFKAQGRGPAVLAKEPGLEAKSSRRAWELLAKIVNTPSGATEVGYQRTPPPTLPHYTQYTHKPDQRIKPWGGFASCSLGALRDNLRNFESLPKESTLNT